MTQEKPQGRILDVHRFMTWPCGPRVGDELVERAKRFAAGEVVAERARIRKELLEWARFPGKKGIVEVEAELVPFLDRICPEEG